MKGKITRGLKTNHGKNITDITKCYGHLLRMNPDKITRTILELGKPATKQRGRPRKNGYTKLKK